MFDQYEQRYNEFDREIDLNIIWTYNPDLVLLKKQIKD